jgi:hypothetical protein
MEFFYGSSAGAEVALTFTVLAYEHESFMGLKMPQATVALANGMWSDMTVDEDEEEEQEARRKCIVRMLHAENQPTSHLETYEHAAIAALAHWGITYAEYPTGISLRDRMVTPDAIQNVSVTVRATCMCVLSSSRD